MLLCFGNQMDSILLGAEGGIGIADVIGNDYIEAFPQPFFPSVLNNRLGFGSEACDQRRSVSELGDSGNDVGVFNQRDDGRLSVLLFDFLG